MSEKSKSWKLDWHRDSLLDSYSAETIIGNYYCMRTVFDTAVLYFNYKEIRRASDGSHILSRIFAEEHFNHEIEKQKHAA